MFNVSGHKIKVAGDSPEAGVYFVSVANPAVRVKVTGHLAENAPHRLIGVIPASLTPGAYTLEVITRFSSGSFFLKEPRVITFGPALTVPQPAS